MRKWVCLMVTALILTACGSQQAAEAPEPTAEPAAELTLAPTNTPTQDPTPTPEPTPEPTATPEPEPSEPPAPIDEAIQFHGITLTLPDGWNIYEEKENSITIENGKTIAQISRIDKQAILSSETREDVCNSLGAALGLAFPNAVENIQNLYFQNERNNGEPVVFTTVDSKDWEEYVMIFCADTGTYQYTIAIPKILPDDEQYELAEAFWTIAATIDFDPLFHFEVDE